MAPVAGAGQNLSELLERNGVRPTARRLEVLEELAQERDDVTAQQLSAFLDGALPASERAACETHLAGCDACRARLAEASALEASLGRALTHAPGEG